MNVIEKYNATLDVKAAEYRAQAEEAARRGDERTRALGLMRQSMLGDMLKALGNVEHQGKRGLLQRQIDAALQKAEACRQREDFDAADREQLKAETILWARQALERLEAEDER